MGVTLAGILSASPVGIPVGPPSYEAWCLACKTRTEECKGVFLEEMSPSHDSDLLCLCPCALCNWSPHSLHLLADDLGYLALLGHLPHQCKGGGHLSHRDGGREKEETSTLSPAEDLGFSDASPDTLLPPLGPLQEWEPWGVEGEPLSLLGGLMTQEPLERVLVKLLVGSDGLFVEHPVSQKDPGVPPLGPLSWSLGPLGPPPGMVGSVLGTSGRLAPGEPASHLTETR